MAAAIKESFGSADVELIDGGRGDFIVTLHVDSEPQQLWDKKGPDRGFPDADHIVDMIRARDVA